MLRQHSTSRTHSDNLKLGILTAFSAGMVNVISVIVFFAFTANVTGHYAILAQELAKGNWYQACVVILWIAVFFFGNFTANSFIIHFKSKERSQLSHIMPLLLEIICLAGAGYYMQGYYKDTLQETEILVGVMLFAMGLQNGLTASISNFSVKTTHLTGLTTDLGILFSMLTRKKYRNDDAVLKKIILLLGIMLSYMAGGVSAGLFFSSIGYGTLYITCGVLAVIIIYDYYSVKLLQIAETRQSFARKVYINDKRLEREIKESVK